MNLIIVESPTKANTLKKFLSKDFEVEASKGHIKDLPKSKLGIDLEKNFEPEYLELAAKKDVISKIKKLAKKAKTVYLATDPDREGEAISQHILEVIETKAKTKRIVFHEITKEALEEALKTPRDIDSFLVDAQTARRVLDRLVGYKLSPLLWKKVRRGLSAGRVQTVTVKLIVEKEREIEKFKAEEYWDIDCDVKPNKGNQFKIILNKIDDKKAKVENTTDAKNVTDDLEKAKYKVLEVIKKEVNKSPYPPFTTSTMTQAAARIYSWSSKKTMSTAQRLYEQGLITYHRTDSMNMSGAAVEKLRTIIVKNFGKEYLSDSPRFYKTKSKVAQEAHEAIRPTNSEQGFNLVKLDLKKDEEMLYSLIWKRFVGTQMQNATYDETNLDVEAKGDKKYLLKAWGQILKFAGWKKIFGGTELIGQELPILESGDLLQLVKVNSEQKFTQPPARYSEAMLIKTLEKLGIGRPSTYAPTISTIQIRNYVEKEEGRFKPTSIGFAVNDFLIEHFPDVFEYQFTADMENQLDEVANGKLKWATSIGTFWKPLAKKLVKVEKNAKRVKIETEKLGKKCPDCKKGELVIRIGRFGKFISCSEFPECKHTEKFLEKINMKCPDCKDGEVIIKRTKRGRKFFGCSRYPDCKWAAWKKPQEETVPNK
jgi:DNA topoisomerase-1